MIDSERFKLLYGPYTAPKCRSGDTLTCEYRRREMKVRGMSDAPIRWPSLRRGRSDSLIVCDDLVRAIRTESSIAVAHHWGVARSVVSQWRRALGVPRMTSGTTRLLIETAAETLTPEVRAIARNRMHAPDVRAKLSAIRTGRSVHPNTIAALREAAKRPKSEDWKRGQSERSKRMWQNREAYGLPARHKWTAKEIALLGTDSDAKIAKILGLKVHAVVDQRRRLGIRRPVRHWTEAECKLLGTATDVEVARKTGRTEQSVRLKRDALGIPSLRTQWTEEELALIGTDTDRAIARKIGKTSVVVQKKRMQLGIPGTVRRWTEEDDSWLGTDTDRVVAKALGRTEVAVTVRRSRLGIRTYRDE
jgi:hypothetical protein